MIQEIHITQDTILNVTLEENEDGTEMKKVKRIKCECPEEAIPTTLALMIGYLPEEEAGMKHKPGKCKGTYEIKKYKRGDRELYLCSCCCLLGDIEIIDRLNMEGKE